MHNVQVHSYITSGCDFCHNSRVKKGWVWSVNGWVTPPLTQGLCVWVANSRSCFWQFGWRHASLWVRSEPVSQGKRLHVVNGMQNCDFNILRSVKHSSFSSSPSLSLFSWFLFVCVSKLGAPGKFQKSISVFLCGIIFQIDLGEDFSHSYS